MTEKDLHIDWISPQGQENAHAIRANFAPVFSAYAEIDALGHRALARIPNSVNGDSNADLVSVVLLRRIVTQFVGIRHLMLSSAVEQAKTLIRAQFETLLAIRYLVHGLDLEPTLDTKSPARSREIRARYYMAASLRQAIYKRQAFIDHVAGRPRSRLPRKKIIKEIQDRINRLNKSFPVQQKRFGNLRCFGKRKAYYDDLKWYSFCSKRRPKSVRALCRLLGMASDYDWLYSAFSELTHPAGLEHDIELREDGQVIIYHPHMAEGFEFLSLWTCRWQMLSLMFIVKVCIPDTVSDHQSVWRKVSPALLKLSTNIPRGF